MCGKVALVLTTLAVVCGTRYHRHLPCAVVEIADDDEDEDDDQLNREAQQQPGEAAQQKVSLATL